MTVAGSSLRVTLRLVATALLALLLAASPADARRKGFSFGSGSKATAAPAANAGSSVSNAMTGVLIGRSLTRATQEKLTRVFDLTETDKTLLPDGRHFHIGRLARFFGSGTLVGWVAPTEFVTLSSDDLKAVLYSEGYNSVAEFEAFLKTAPPLALAKSEKPEKAIEPAETLVASARVETSSERSPLEWAIMICCVAALVGLVGYCVVSARANRREEAAPPPAGRTTARVARVGAALPVPAARMAGPSPAPAVRQASIITSAARPVMPPPITRVAAAPAPASTPIPRRAPRDLSGLTRKPA